MELKEQEKAEQIIQETPPEERYEDPEDWSFGNSQKTFDAEPVEGAHVQIRDMADQRRRNKRLMGISFIWFMTIAVLAIGALFAFQNRQKIVESLPGTASIYKSLGINVKTVGLEFEDPTVRQMLVNGDNTLIIEGHIVNITDETRSIPLLELSIVTKDGDVVANWVIEPPQSTLEAEGRIPYTAEYPNPPVDGVTIKYRFLDEDDLMEPVETPADIVEAPAQVEEPQ